jgi:hypothetical protein
MVYGIDRVMHSAYDAGIHPAPGTVGHNRHVTKGAVNDQQAGRPAKVTRCRWCGREFDAIGRGRPPLYCRHGCRQQAFMARKLAAAHGLGDDDLIVSRTQVEELQSRVYCLRAAIEDVDRDLRSGGGKAAARRADLREALDWLLENAEPVAQIWVQPRVSR